LSSDKLYKLSLDNNLPFHKYYKFIKGEITKCKEKINSKHNYAKKKYEVVKYILLIYIRLGAGLHLIKIILIVEKPTFYFGYVLNNFLFN